MSKNKKKAALKTARKAVRKELANDLTVQLETVFGKFEQQSKKASKEIKKAAVRIAKKLSALIKTDRSPVVKPEATVEKIAASRARSTPAISPPAKDVTPVAEVVPPTKAAAKKTAQQKKTESSTAPVPAVADTKAI